MFFRVFVYMQVAVSLLSGISTTIAQTDSDIANATPSPYESSLHTVNLSPSGDWRIDGVVQGNKWGGPVGTGAVISYSFPDENSVWANPYGERDEPKNGFSSYNEAEREVARAAIAAWEATGADITFVEVNETSTSVGDIRFGWTSINRGFVTAWSSSPSEGPHRADIWNFTGVRETTTPQAFLTILIHELGHGLGLYHDGSGSTNLPFEYDNKGYTVMSYNQTPPIPGLSTSPYPKEFDTLAVRWLYGVKGEPDVVFLGDHRSYGSSKNDIFIGELGNNFIDGGDGEDTIIFDDEKSLYGINPQGIQLPQDGNYTSFENIEYLQFADISVAINLNSENSAGKSVQILTATFGEEVLIPEYIGAGVSIFRSGMSFIEVAQFILDSFQFQSLVAPNDNVGLINHLVVNVLGRQATNDEISYVLGLMDNELSRADLVLAAAQLVDLTGYPAVEFR